MGIPVGGQRKPVTITDCQGREVGIDADGKLLVAATVNVTGGSPSAFTDQQDLSLNPLDSTDNIAVSKVAEWLALNLGSGLVADQVLNVIFKSADGAAFDVPIIEDETLAAGTTSKWFSFPANTLLRAGDHIKVTLTDTGGGETQTASLTIMFSV